MTTALDLIKGALRNIGAYQSGETLSQSDQNDSLNVLNEMLDSMSTSKTYIFGTNEYVMNWVNGQSQYKIGNPTNAQLGLQSFQGTLTSGSPIITNVTNIPSGLVAGTTGYGPGAGSTVTDTNSLISTGTQVTAIGTTTVTLSKAPTGTLTNYQDQIGYSTPGDFSFPRPLRITSGFTRINQLDFWLDVMGTQDEYNAILYKAQPGPWPVVGWYNNTFPFGLLNVYQTPGQNAQVHLFCDTVLSNLSLTTTVQMPQGYVRMLKWLLARDLAPMYGTMLSPQQISLMKEAENMVRELNREPAARTKYERELSRGNRPDGGWILHGGYR